MHAVYVKRVSLTPAPTAGDYFGGMSHRPLCIQYIPHLGGLGTPPAEAPLWALVLGLSSSDCLPEAGSHA